MSPAVELSKGRGRESKEALADVKTKLEFALSRLNDQDTQRSGVEEIKEFLQTLYADWFPMVISCISEAGANLKPSGRCESVKLLGLLAELHGDMVVPLLPRILNVVITRLQDSDLHLREACAETVFLLAQALVVNAECAPVFATLLKPLFGALSEHNKGVQIGAAACICSAIQGAPTEVVRENLGRLCSRLVQNLSLPLGTAKPQLLRACVFLMQAVEADFDDVLPSLMPCLEGCVGTSDWQTRKQAVEVLQTIGDNETLGSSLDLSPGSSTRPTSLQRRVAMILEPCKVDKVRAVREAAKDVLASWSIKPPGNAALRSSSPINDREAPRGHNASTPARPSSPVLRSSWDLGECGEGVVKSARPSQHENVGKSDGRPRSVKACSRERDDDARQSHHSPDEVPVSERAVRDAAVKAAISGAALNSTKKPKPKKERLSIFHQANASFFKSGGPGASLPQSSIDEDVGGDFPAVEMPALRDDEAEHLSLESAGAVQDEIDVSSWVKARERIEMPRDMTNEVSPMEPPPEGPRDDARHEEVSISSKADSYECDDEGMLESLSGRIMVHADAASERRPGGAQVRSGLSSRRKLEVPQPQLRAMRPLGVSGADRSVDEVFSPTPMLATSEHVEGDVNELNDVMHASVARNRAPGVSKGRKGNSHMFTAAPQPQQRLPQRGRSSPPRKGHAVEVVSPQTQEDQVMARGAANTLSLQTSLAEPSKLDYGESEINGFVQMPSGTSLDLLGELDALRQRLQVGETERRTSEERLMKRLRSLEFACECQTEQLQEQRSQLELMCRRCQLQEDKIKVTEERLHDQAILLQQAEQQLQKLDSKVSRQDQKHEHHEEVFRRSETRMDRHDAQISEHRAFLDLLSAEVEEHVFTPPSASERQHRDRLSADSDVRVRGDSGRFHLDGPDPNQLSRPMHGRSLDSWGGRSSLSKSGESPLQLGLGGSGLAGSSGDRPSVSSLRDTHKVPESAVRSAPKKGVLWERIVELCSDHKYLEAYKQVIAEPEESCLLRLMQHTGPIVERLDAESNSRLIRRLIHILSSPTKEPSACIKQIFSWLWQGLEVNIHFTTSQVEDLAAALQKVAAPQSSLLPAERADAAKLLQRVSALRRG